MTEKLFTGTLNHNKNKKQKTFRYKLEKCLSSHSCHFVKNIFFTNELLHANVHCVCNRKAKYKITQSEAMTEVDRPVYTLL